VGALVRARAAGLLYPGAGDLARKSARIPDWPEVQRELRRKHITLPRRFPYMAICLVTCQVAFMLEPLSDEVNVPEITKVWSCRLTTPVIADADWP
jgi:hypothetical protein